MNKIYLNALLISLLSTSSLLASADTIDDSKGATKSTALADVAKAKESLSGMELDKDAKKKARNLLNKMEETALTIRQVDARSKTGEQSRDSMLLNKKFNNYKEQLEKILKPKEMAKD